MMETAQASPSLDVPSHTPGPWTWQKSTSGDHRHLRSGDDFVIYADYASGDYGLSITGWVDVRKEDAALIEAAPDLLAALRGLLRDLGDDDGESYQAARAAIRKAGA